MCVSQNQLSPAPEAFGLHSALRRTVAHWGGRTSIGAIVMKTRPCKNCRVPFELIRSKRSNVFCSRSCANTRSNNPAWKGGVRSDAAKWQKEQWRRYPKKMRARQDLRYAVRKKYIERGPCEVCGVKKTDAHHNDYSKPLDVIWLCRKHHQQHHAKGTQQ